MRAAPARLSAKAGRLLRDERTELFLSAASAWEIAVKVSLGKLRLPCGVEEFVVTRAAATGVTALPITQFHAIESAILALASPEIRSTGCSSPRRASNASS